MADMHCMFLLCSTPSTNADKALLRDGCFEFNHLQIIAVHMQHCAGVSEVCVCLCVSPVKGKASEIGDSLFLRESIKPFNFL